MACKISQQASSALGKSHCPSGLGQLGEQCGVCCSGVPGCWWGGGLAHWRVVDLSWDAQRQHRHSPSPSGQTLDQPSDPEARWGGEGNPRSLPLQLGVGGREHEHFALRITSLQWDRTWSLSLSVSSSVKWEQPLSHRGLQSLNETRYIKHVA